MKKSFYVATFYFSLLCFWLQGQTYFDKVYGVDGNQFADISDPKSYQLKDSTYLFFYITIPVLTNHITSTCIVLNPQGDILNASMMGNTVNDLVGIAEVIKTQEGFVGCGYYNSYQPDTMACFLAKIGSGGTINNFHTYYFGQKYVYGTVVYKTQQGNFLLGGFHYSDGPNPATVSDFQAFALCTDNSGTELWRRNYGSEGWRERIKDIAPTPDGGFLLAGYRSVPISNGDFQAMLIKIDSVGHQQWLRTYGTSEWNELFHGIQQSADGNYIVIGYINKTPGANHSQGPHRILKINAEGDILWDKTYMDDQGGNWLDDFVQLPDGSIVASGATTATPNGSQAGYILKTDAQGELLWQHIYDRTTTHIDLFYSINTTLDAGFVLTGFSRRIDSTGSTQDAWILKVDSMGCAAPNCLVVDEVEEVQPLWAPAPRVWPNPFSEILWVEAPVNLGRLQVSLYDCLGRQVMAPQWIAPGTQTSLSTECLAPGLYYLRWQRQNGEGQGVVRVVSSE